MGRIAAPYGVRGWLKVVPYTDAVDTLLDHPGWWIAEGAGEAAMQLRLVEGRVHSGQLVAKLAGVETREAAARLRGREIAVPRDALPETDEHEVYLADLVGLAVVNRAGRRLGTVTEVSDNGAQPLLRLAGEGGAERLVPFVTAVIDEVDFETSRIVVDWEAEY